MKVHAYNLNKEKNILSLQIVLLSLFLHSIDSSSSLWKNNVTTKHFGHVFIAYRNKGGITVYMWGLPLYGFTTSRLDGPSRNNCGKIISAKIFWYVHSGQWWGNSWDSILLESEI